MKPKKPFEIKCTNCNAVVILRERKPEDNIFTDTKIMVTASPYFLTAAVVEIECDCGNSVEELQHEEVNNE